MRLSTLDEITRRGLLEDGLPIHYYFEYLTHGATCLRELSFDTLKIINKKRSVFFFGFLNIRRLMPLIIEMK